MISGVSARRRSAAAPVRSCAAGASAVRARCSRARHRGGRPGHAGPRGGRQEVGAVRRRGRRLDEAVAGVEGVELGHGRERVGLVGEPRRAPAGGRRGPDGAREAGLLEVEGEQRTAAGVPERDDRGEPLLAQEHHAGGDVEQRLLMDQRQVVVDRAGVLGLHRRRGREQVRTSAWWVTSSRGASGRRPSARPAPSRARPARWAVGSGRLVDARDRGSRLLVHRHVARPAPSRVGALMPGRPAARSCRAARSARRPRPRCSCTRPRAGSRSPDDPPRSTRRT